MPSFPLQLLHNGNPWQQKLDFAAVLMRLHPCWSLSLEEGTKPDKLFRWKCGELRNKGDPVLCLLSPALPALLHISGKDAPIDTCGRVCGNILLSLSSEMRLAEG